MAYRCPVLVTAREGQSWSTADYVILLTNTIKHFLFASPSCMCKTMLWLYELTSFILIAINELKVTLHFKNCTLQLHHTEVWVFVCVGTSTGQILSQFYLHVFYSGTNTQLGKYIILEKAKQYWNDSPRIVTQLLPSREGSGVFFTLCLLKYYEVENPKKHTTCLASCLYIYKRVPV